MGPFWGWGFLSYDVPVVKVFILKVVFLYVMS